LLFNSFLFAGFFALVLPLAAMLAGRVRVRNELLLVASYVFYACWDWRFLGLIWISTAVDYACGRLLDPPEPAPAWLTRLARRRKFLLASSLVINLGLLGFFKYFDFFAAGAAAGLKALGLTVDPWSLGLVLPVGISFYTFQSLSYSIDVYRGQVRAERDPLTFALFVAFFPQLVAGPIERAARLLPQLAAATRVSWTRLTSGAWLIGWGLIKKVVLADNLARVVDAVFSSHDPSAGAVLVAVYAFAMQIYCDFSGYSNMARGLARCLGFEIMVNFRLPFFAANPREFWRRWHISLSSWLRDYLYIPLGGNRRGHWRNRLALLLTMVLGGLWHGAGFGFLLWGVYHGLVLLAQRGLAPLMTGVRKQGGRLAQACLRLVGIGLTFHLVCFGWLFFRARDLDQLLRLLGNLLVDGSETLSGLAPMAGPVVLASAAVLLLVQLAQAAWDDLEGIWRLPTAVRALIYTTMMLGFIWFGEFSGEPFIYFQF